jgi:hypothetical protein
VAVVLFPTRTRLIERRCACVMPPNDLRRESSTRQVLCERRYIILPIYDLVIGTCVGSLIIRPCTFFLGIGSRGQRLVGLDLPNPLSDRNHGSKEDPTELLQDVSVIAIKITGEPTTWKTKGTKPNSQIYLPGLLHVAPLSLDWQSSVRSFPSPGNCIDTELENTEA